MIIDFHTHTFPEDLASRALTKLSKSANMLPHTNGTKQALIKSMSESGVDKSVLLPVATKPAQSVMINWELVKEKMNGENSNLISFGAMHPDNEDYKELLKVLAKEKIPGIKLHPIFQDTYIDDKKYLRIIDEAFNNGLLVMVHAGYDISFPGNEMSSPAHLKKMIDAVEPNGLILAHMGAWGCWKDAFDLIKPGVYFDTSFTLGAIPYLHQLPPSEKPWTKEQEELSNEDFIELVNAIGAKNVLFGSDSPWTNQKEAIELVKNTGLCEEDINLILGENGERLLCMM